MPRPREPRQALIYAELLPNIRQVSVGCSLPSPSTPDTEATVSPDGLTLRVKHDGVETSIRLPGPVAPSQQLPVRHPGTAALSWRFPLARSWGHKALLPVPEEPSIPWSASDVRPESPIACRACRAVIVSAGRLKAWKNLPSENWAEMMEFWHCHKPHHHRHGHGHDEAGLASKGYSASSRISAQPGVGFIDISSFLVSESDIFPSSITKALLFPSSDGTVGHDEMVQNNELHKLQDGKTGIFCASCESILGVLNDEISVSIFKWGVCMYEHDQQSPRPTLSHCISAMLLATMAQSGCSKSIIMPMETWNRPRSKDAQPEPLLNIWVFNRNIAFSSTEEPCNLAIPAVKVLYRMISASEADKLLDSMTSDVQDITLPTSIAGALLEHLTRSNGYLPHSDRLFREWTVGLLEKWDGGGEQELSDCG
ncbi:ubiquitin-conjugating enzyme E2C-binding protein [Durotheca rogersii]|uniref:ubiquitin-conjugating enzyme E2C-binding protein n=1 Tax=Durotheca rogersii TaxID=419775 RepID=UPI0022201F2A|nr:ubiquitin-conjugating enzyme E2C-binding protein [Durotheca rogersii]KAI5868677.1 ubiquitin-conjugating enzyme E2C-binding protein [Durotheca rogersii]